MKKSYHTTVQQKYTALLNLVKQLRQTRQWNSLPAAKKNSLLQQVRALLPSLRKTLTTLDFKKALGAAALVCGLTFNSKAQSFAAVQTNPFSVTALDSMAFPTFGDLDGDGDNDMLASNYYGDLFYFQNTGSGSAPAFAAPTTNPFGLTNMGNGFMVYPLLVDMDNDGDLDLFAGDYYGSMLYFQNTGSALAPAFGPGQINTFSITQVPYNASPVAADMDNDGDNDLIIGDFYGDTHYFQNTGTASAPAFGPDQLNPFGLITTEYNNAPAVIDIDLDGDLDLFIAGFYGDIEYYQNTGTATAPAFATAVVNPFGLTNVGYYIAPVFADMDSDGDKDLWVGELYGDFYYFQHTSSATAVTENKTPQELNAYPVPSSSNVTFSFDQMQHITSAQVFNSTGQQVMSVGAAQALQVTLDISALATGAYTVIIQTENNRYNTRFIKQ